MKRFRWLILILCFAWMAFVYASFYLVRQQRPFDGENLAAAGATALALCTAGGLFALGAALGRRVSIWLRIEFAGVGEQVILTTGLGLGALSLGILVLGLLGGLRRAILFSLLGALALLLVPDGIALVRALRGIHLPGTRTVLALYLTAMLVLTLLIALAPPTDWDGLFYHLTFPRLYLERGRIVAVTDVPHQFFPGMMEMLFTAAMAVQGDVAAKLLHGRAGVSRGPRVRRQGARLARGDGVRGDADGVDAGRVGVQRPGVGVLSTGGAVCPVSLVSGPTGGVAGPVGRDVRLRDGSQVHQFRLLDRDPVPGDVARRP